MGHLGTVAAQPASGAVAAVEVTFGPVPDAPTYARHLSVRANAITTSRSGERTRLRLLAAGADLLKRTSYRDLSVAAVSDRAGQAKGTFYLYFPTKEAFLVELLQGYLGFEASTFQSIDPAKSPFLGYRLGIEWYEKTFARNAGILRCMVQMGEADPQVRRLWHERNARIVDRIVAETVARLKKPPADQRLLRLAIRTIGTMLDQSLFERYRVQVGPGIASVETEFLIEFHAVISYRALFGENPPARELRYTKALLQIPKLR